MSKSLSWLSTRSIVSWSLFAVNIVVLIAAFITGILWLSALSVTLSLVVLAIFSVIENTIHTRSKFSMLKRKLTL